MVQQVLEYTSSAIEEALPRELEELKVSLENLPALAGLMPSSWELREVVEGVDAEGVMERLAVLLQEEVGDEEGGSEVVKEGFTNRADAAAPALKTGKKKKRQKAKTKKKSSEVKDEEHQNNMFQMLA